MRAHSACASSSSPRPSASRARAATPRARSGSCVSASSHNRSACAASPACSNARAAASSSRAASAGPSASALSVRKRRASTAHSSAVGHTRRARRQRPTRPPGCRPATSPRTSRAAAPRSSERPRPRWASCRRPGRRSRRPRRGRRVPAAARPPSGAVGVSTKISASSNVASQSGPGGLRGSATQPTAFRSERRTARRARTGADPARPGWSRRRRRRWRARSAAAPSATSASADGATSPAIIRPEPIRGAQHALVPGGEIVLLELEPRRLQRQRLPLLAPDGARDRAQQLLRRLREPGGRRDAREQSRRTRTAARASSGPTRSSTVARCTSMPSARPTSKRMASEFSDVGAPAAGPGRAPRAATTGALPRRAVSWMCSPATPSAAALVSIHASRLAVPAGIAAACRAAARRGKQLQRRFDQVRPQLADEPARRRVRQLRPERARRLGRERARPARPARAGDALALDQIQHARDRRLPPRRSARSSRGCAPSPAARPVVPAAARRADPPPARAGRRPPRDRPCRARRARRRRRRRAPPARASLRPADPARRRAGTRPPRPARRAPDRAGSIRCGGAAPRARRLSGKARLRRPQRLDRAASTRPGAGAGPTGAGAAWDRPGRRPAARRSVSMARARSLSAS